MHDYQRLALACLLETATHKDIVEYIQSVTGGDDEYHQCLFEAYDKDIRIARSKILEFINLTYPDFAAGNIDTSEACYPLLLHQCESFISGQLKPHEFCSFYYHFENIIFHQKTSCMFDNFDASVIDAMYDACDWCDESWTPENSPHLIAETKQVILNIHARTSMISK